MIKIPLLRAGVPYYSLTTNVLRDFRSGDPVAQISLANPGLIAKDMKSGDRYQRELQKHSVKELLEICRKAADHFVNSTLPVGDDSQSPQDYVRCLSFTTGMPEALGEKNMLKIQFVMMNMESVLGGLTRGLDLSILDSG